MYSPTLGRFVTTDPTGFQAGDVNLYRFVENNPTNEVDPSGLDSRSSQVVYSKITIKVTLVWGDEGDQKGMPGWGDVGTRQSERERALHLGLNAAYKMAVKARDELKTFISRVCKEGDAAPKIDGKRFPQDDSMITLLNKYFYGDKDIPCACIHKLYDAFNKIVSAFENSKDKPLVVGLLPGKGLNAATTGAGGWNLMRFQVDNLWEKDEVFAATIIHEMAHAYAGWVDTVPAGKGPFLYYRSGSGKDAVWEAVHDGKTEKCSPTTQAKCVNASALQYFALDLYKNGL